MSDTAPTRPHTKWTRVIVVSLGAALAVGVIVLAFLWPTVTSSVKNLPVAVSGPSAQLSGLEKALNQKGSGAFTLTTVDGRSAVVSGIRDRSYDGGIVLGDSPEVLTASAASPTVTQLMSQVQAQLQREVDAQLAAKVAAAQQAATRSGTALVQGAAPAAPTVTVKLTDVAPFASTDARGTGITAAAFPLTIGGMIGGIVISLLVSGVVRRLAAAAGYAVAVGFVVVSVLQPWLGILQGGYLLNVAAAALAFFGTAALILGTTSILGNAGVAVGSVVTILIGNPLASAAAPVQFLPEPWGAVGQWFVPGASTTLLRDLSYFPDASTLFPWLVLAGWGALGVTLSLVGHFRSREVVHVEDWDEEPVQTVGATA